MTGIAISPDGRLVAVTSSDGATRVVDVKSRQVSLLPRGRAAHDVAFSPDGKFLIVGYDEGVRVWRLDDRTAHAFSAGGRVTQVAFSPDGKSLLTVAGDSAVVRDLDGRRRAVLTDSEGALGPNRNVAAPVVDAALGPDGQVVTGSSDGTAVIWDAGFQPHELQGPGPPIRTVSFSDDGKFVLVTSRDGRVSVWEAASRRLLAQFYEGAGLTNAALSPDGRDLITAGAAGIRVQPCEACLPIADLLRLGHWTKEELRRPGG